MSKEKYDFDKLPDWLQELWKENPNIARRAEKYIAELIERQTSEEVSKQHDSKALHIADVSGCFIGKSLKYCGEIHRIIDVHESGVWVMTDKSVPNGINLHWDNVELLP